MKQVNDIQKLMKRQKNLMNGILVLTKKLFDVQTQLSTLTYNEIKKEKEHDGGAKEDLLTSQQVCDKYKISASTLYRMRTYDGLPCMKVDGRKNVMYKVKDLEEFWSKNRK